MEKGKINSITIEGVKGEGDYDLSDNKSDNKWDLSNSTATGSYTVSFAGDEGKVEGKRALTGVAKDNKVLMMIPQTLGDGAKVTINFTPTGGSATEASFPLGGTTWDPGSHVTYVLSTTKMLNLNMGTISYPDGWNSVNNIKSSYIKDDAIGMYVVDKNNKVKEANLKFTYNGSKWTVESGKEFKGSPQYNYFVYYPYQSVLPGAPAKNASNIDVTSAEKFFADAITEWGKKFDTSSGNTIDQSDIAKMNSFDLQIGKADGLGESGTTINFSSMTHAMGLAEIVLGKTSFTDCICKLVGYEEYPTWKGTTTSYASCSIKNHTMYGIADHRYVSIVKPGENSFMSNTDKDAWKEEVKLSPAANEVKSGTAYNSFNPTTPYAYTLAVGDIYYSDGAISHQEDALLKSTSKRFPIGIVGYITMNGDGNYWTEKKTKEDRIGGHALIMGLKHIGSKSPKDMGTRCYWYPSKTSCGTFNVADASYVKLSENETYGSGFLCTKNLVAKGSNFQAAIKADSYNLELPTPKMTTGWFLPSVGQYYAVFSQLGGGIKPENWEVNEYFENQTILADNINNALSIVGSDYYTEFMQTVNDDEWTTSESGTIYAICASSGIVYGYGDKSLRFYRNWKSNNQTVRPFLAF